MHTGVLVVTGTGGIGQAALSRLSIGRRVLVGDVSEESLASTAERLRGSGHDVTTQVVDVSDRASVDDFARTADGLGPVMALVHTAGVSPAMGTAEMMLKVDYLGTALVTDAFGGIVARGGAGVVMSSIAGHVGPAFSPELARSVALTPADELLGVPEAAPENFPHPSMAYAFAKQANRLRVAADAKAWAARGARLNSISPGLISTPLGQLELASDTGANMRALMAMGAITRIGTPEDVAGAIDFLVSPAAGFITGNDLLVDGGMVGALRVGRESLSAMGGH
ncbi:SDR family oxidoreductase [Microbacterium sp. No. 7]|uniref:SDR family oxidoreductase n=1 Tax=Microbacterium sp. No. 7 TaxID=1714373 RepID=UPI0006D08530|nr:SDR family oxidoreductase [Microbacterium sp. No. 7]ALJ21188.1 short-chain dehydrogenase [Microbacterium sp. No. 7]